MRYFFDTEFDAQNERVTLLSIGIVAEDGREFYAVNSEADHSKCSQFVRDNVLPELGTDFDMTRAEIRDSVRKFIGDDPHPLFFAYFSAYDWVLFCQLWGILVDLPQGWPQFCMDLMQISVHVNCYSRPPQLAHRHNALSDARWNFELYKHLKHYSGVPAIF